MTRVVPAVSRALEILDLFRHNGESLSVPEISTRLDLPKSSTHELVQTLVAHRFLAPSPSDPRRFELDLMVFELGNAYAARLDVWQEAWETVRLVAAQTDETTQMAILDGTDSVYLAKVDSSQPVRLVSEVGKRVPAHCTAGGKVLLSGLTDEELARRYAGRSLEAMTPNSITSMKALRAELSRARRAGFACDRSESNPAVCCVAAPVRGQHEELIGALSVSIPTTRIDDSWPETLVPTVIEATRDLSFRIGYRERPAPAPAAA
jgi:IclR family KDG regulon transcriptional repressor